MAIAGAACLAACTDMGSEPTAARLDSGLLPLELGNRWVYRSCLTLEMTIGDGEPTIDTSTWHREQEMIGFEELFGRSYAVQEDRALPEDETIDLWFRYRQDDTGLYAADVAANVPPNLNRGESPQHLVARSASGTIKSASTLEARFASHPHRASILQAREDLRGKMELLRSLAGNAVIADAADREDEEITRLAYPLRVGSRWTIRSKPFVVAAGVDGVDRVETPGGSYSAWRVRIEGDFMGPDDEVLVWWGSIGIVATRLRVEGIATNETGEPIGRFVGTQEEVLVEFDPASSTSKERIDRPREEHR
jgi:hypothetical protein